MFSKHYDALKRIVTSKARKLGGTKVDPDDALHELYLKMERYPGAADVKTDSDFLKLAGHVARYEIGDIYNKATKTGQREHGMDDLESPTSADNPAATAQRDEAVATLKKRMEHLPQAERDALEMYYFQGMSKSDIARKLGVDESAIRQRLTKAQQRLAGMMPGFALSMVLTMLEEQHELAEAV